MSSRWLQLPRALGNLVVVGTVLALLAGCAHDDVSQDGSGSPERSGHGSDTLMIRAEREQLSSDENTPVVHDNEVMALADHAGRLYAATDQWQYQGPNPAGQILAKDSATSPWHVVEQTQSLRVEALDSFSIPSSVAAGRGHALLVTQAITHGESRIQWLLDGAKHFAPSDSFTLANPDVDVRSFGAHEDHGVWSVYAGANPTGILRGSWSAADHSLHFDPTPELVAAPPSSPGLKTQKVTGFADCEDALYTSINTKLYRRNDGDLPLGTPRWVLVYQAPPAAVHNSGIRGLSCASHHGHAALLLSTEGSGNVYRLDNLPHGIVARGAPLLVPTLEFSPIPAIRQMLTTMGTPVPAAGAGSVVYVIAAYNNFEPVRIDGRTEQAFGFEWGYAGTKCPSTRHCGPTSFGVVTYDAAACFAVRTDAPTPIYTQRCLGGLDFEPKPPTNPIRADQAFVSIRTIKRSPFDDHALYFGGYDCNFYPADGTAWVARAPVALLHQLSRS